MLTDFETPPMPGELPSPKRERILTDEDCAVLAHVLEKPDAWVRHALDRVGLAAVVAKARKAEYVAAYRAASAKNGYTPRGPLPSKATRAMVDAAALLADAKRKDDAARETQRRQKIMRLLDEVRNGNR